ncbi:MULTISPECIES: hypothetical protein [unclassified Clostridium]|uniref:hypothetical protein n=1 Tax=unclassified Clostridium TaxID=2614128 RepID=UPI001C8B501A|nr:MULTISPECIES: hypothetical protein [unclassified Clostridium]MBX9136721.1 hypothetical protein [Clostridium sp. K12(2020)]MBX9145146.1 hypothetical protein [Clostridium sp. K13]
MPNTIALAKKYVPLLDEVYKKSAITSVLDSDASLAKEGANTNEIIIPMIDMDGLGDYDRNSGYVNGDVTLTWQTVKFNYERGRMFNVDAMDDEESVGLAFGKLSGEFIRTKVVPEVDAFRFAKYSSLDGITLVSATLTTGEEVIKALRVAATKMDEDEVPSEQRILFITPTLKGMIDDMDTTKSKEVMKKFSAIYEVPQTRFYSAIELNDGKTESQTKGGYKKASGGKDINFMIIEPGALLQFPKHVVPKIVRPEHNQSADAWKFGYRNYGLADGYKNKRAGIYTHTKA